MFVFSYKPAKSGLRLTDKQQSLHFFFNTMSESSNSLVILAIHYSQNPNIMKNLNRFSGVAVKHSLLLAVMLFFISIKVYSQLNIPLTSCQNIAGTYTDLGTNGTVISTTNFDDASSAAVNIGFTFNFNGQAFTQFVLNTNGFIRLGPLPPSVDALFFAGGASYTGGPFNSASTSDVNLICGFNHDLTGATNPEYRVYTSGTAPNRECIIQFKNLRDKTTSPLEQFSSISFQIILYEGSDIVDIRYGTFTASANAHDFKSAAVGLKGSGNTAGQMIGVTKGSTTIYSAATFLNGNYTGNAFNFRNSVLPDPGRTLRFMPIKPNDRAIMEAYTLGKSPIPFGNPLTITAWVKNGGVNAMAAATCTLNITGANPFNNVQNIPALNAGDSTLVTFATYTPTVVGINNVEVSLPSDDNILNNTKTKVIETNLNSYSYAQGPQAAGGVGFTGAIGDFVAKFTTNSSQSINQVNVQFATGGQPFQIGIWAATATNTPGTLLHSTTTYTSTQGTYTVLINPPVSVPAGAFFVGVRQTSTTNVSFGYQAEVPIRSGHFFYASSGSTTWTDFAPGSPFRFLIEPKFALQADVGVIAAKPVTGTTLVAGTAYNLYATVANYGISAQNNIPVYYSVNGGSPVGPINTSISINQNDTTGISFSGTNTFTPATSGNYTLRFFTQLTNDLSTQNDTFTVALMVVPAPSSAMPYSTNFTTHPNWTSSGVSGLWAFGICTGATGQTNDTAAFADFYTFPSNSSGLLKSPAFNISSLAHPAIQFDLAYRTRQMQSDTLEVLVSTDGGLTFLPGNPPIYSRATFSNPPLTTTTADTAVFFPTAAANWRKETVPLDQFMGATNIMIALRGGSGNGNRCWVDNFTILNGNIPTVTTDPVTNVGLTTAQSGGNVSASGTLPVTSRGVCWSISPNPTIADPKTTDGSGTGAFTSNITGLAVSTPYYLRAYASSGFGTGYGSEITFTTQTPSTVPTVTTTPVTSITHFGATLGGNVTADGGSPVTARGVCYSLLPNPTVLDSKTVDGTGTGTFTSNLTGLAQLTNYFARAYATNSVGTSYGAQETFSTLIDAIDEPSVDGYTIFAKNQHLYICSSEPTAFTRVALYDMSGREVFAVENIHCQNSLMLELPILQSGVYLAGLTSGEKSTRQKISLLR